MVPTWWGFFHIDHHHTIQTIIKHPLFYLESRKFKVNWFSPSDISVWLLPCFPELLRNIGTTSFLYCHNLGPIFPNKALGLALDGLVRSYNWLLQKWFPLYMYLRLFWTQDQFLCYSVLIENFRAGRYFKHLRIIW